MATITPMPAAVRRSRQILGMCLVGGTAVIWVISSFLSESLVSAKTSGKAVVPPFLLTYMGTTLFTIYLPIIYSMRWFSARLRKQAPSMIVPSKLTLHTAGSRLINRQQQYVALDSEQPHVAEQHQASHSATAGLMSNLDKGTDVRACMRAAFWCWPLWFMAQLAFNMSLARTSVTSNTILSSSSSLFTFALSVLFCGERFSLGKLACIFVCIAGTALVTFSDNMSESSEAGSPPPGGSSSSNASQAVLGDLLCVSSAAIYSGYTVLMRQLLGEGGKSDPNDHTAHAKDLTVYQRIPEVALIVEAGRSCSVCNMTTVPVTADQQHVSLLMKASKCKACRGQDSAAHDGTHCGTQPSEAESSSAGVSAVSAKSPVTGQDRRRSFSMDFTAAVVEPNTTAGQIQALPFSKAERNQGDVGGPLVVVQDGVGEDTESVALFFGFIGLFTSVLLAPVLMVMSIMGTVSLADIPATAYGIIALEGILDYVLADLLWARAVMLLGPTMATLGLSVQIPLAAVAEFFRDHPAWVKQGSTIAMTLLGTVFVLASFVGVQLFDSRDREEAELKGVGLDDRSDDSSGEGRVETSPAAKQ